MYTFCKKLLRLGFRVAYQAACYAAYYAACHAACNAACRILPIDYTGQLIIATVI